MTVFSDNRAINGSNFTVLGVSGNFGRPEHDASAAIVIDGRVVAAAEEERFIRYKGAFGVMPDSAVKFCLREAGISIDEVDVLAFPRSSWKGHELRLRAWCNVTFGGEPREVRFVDHHLAHAACSALSSGLEEALCISFDMSGDGWSTAAYDWSSSTGFTYIDHYEFPNSLGIFAALVTQYLGFNGTEEEGKIMALAQTGEPCVDLSKWVRIDEDGFEFNRDMLHSEVFKRYPEFHTRQLPYFSSSWEKSLPFRRHRGAKIESKHRDFAASSQQVLNLASEAYIRRVSMRSSKRNLCIAGGVANNSVMNGRVLKNSEFKSVYVPSAPGDAGSSLGAALYVTFTSGCSIEPVVTSRLGPDIGQNNAERIREAGTFNVLKIDADDMAVEVSKRICNGQVLGIMNGRLEFGPRALGGRSFITHPFREDSKKRLDKIKSRAWYRPFAPSLHPDEVRRTLRNHASAPFMSFTFDVQKSDQDRISNAIAMDGSTRPQTLCLGDGLIHDVAALVMEIDGVGAVVNTSLNLSGEPIALGAAHGLNILSNTEMDALVVGDCLVTKRA